MQELNKQSWMEATTSRPESNFLSSWEYGESQLSCGSQVFRRMLDGPQPAMYQAILREAKRGRYLEIGGGPLLDLDSDQAVAITESLTSLAKDNDCVFVRLRPQIELSDSHLARMSDLGYVRAPMHLLAEHTSIIDLGGQDEDSLLAAMRKNTRYEIRRSIKKDVNVIVDNSEKSIIDFVNLLSDTAKRQSFVLGSSQQILAEITALCTGGGKIYKSFAGDVHLATAFVVSYGQESSYLYGASTAEGRNLPGSYAALWQAIRDSLEAGIERFNLWGTAPADQPDHRYAGVTTFKNGFGGRTVEYLPAHDLVVKGMAYQKTKAVEVLRKKKRGL